MVSFDKNGYIIDGKPTLLASGELQYFKLTRGEWKRRLLQIRLSGMNAVSVYFAWNYHEQSEGEWDFSGDRDVEYFLQLAAECAHPTRSISPIATDGGTKSRPSSQNTSSAARARSYSRRSKTNTAIWARIRRKPTSIICATDCAHAA